MKHYLACFGLVRFGLTEPVTYQNLNSPTLRADTGSYGPTVEEVH
jgi:hypothetical protein